MDSRSSDCVVTTSTGRPVSKLSVLFKIDVIRFSKAHIVKCGGARDHY